MGRHKKRKKTSPYYQLFLSLVITLFLGAIGVGYAVWHDFLKVGGTISTGFVEPVFVNPQLSLEGGKGQGDVIISADSKSLYIKIDDARPHDVYFLDFEIKNNGTLPIKAEAPQINCDKALEVKLLGKPIGLLKGQETDKGRMRIKVKQEKENSENDFMVQLSFRQAVVL